MSIRREHGSAELLTNSGLRHLWIHAFLMHTDLLSERVIVAFAAPRKRVGVRENGINSVVESSGLIRMPSSDLILALYDQCRVQISQDLQNEKARYVAVEHPEMDERLSRREIGKWLKDALNRRVVDVSLEPADVAIIDQALEESADFVLVAVNGGFKSVLVLDDFSRVIAHKTLDSLVEADRV